jgi:hypothetical protein
MAAVIDDDSLSQSKTRAAQQVLERFDERVLTQRYLDLYAEILAERARTAS